MSAVLVALVEKYGVELVLWLIDAGVTAAEGGHVELPEGISIGDAQKVRDLLPDPLPQVVVLDALRRDRAAREKALAAAAEADAAIDEAIEPFGGILKPKIEA